MNAEVSFRARIYGAQVLRVKMCGAEVLRVRMCEAEVYGIFYSQRNNLRFVVSGFESFVVRAPPPSGVKHSSIYAERRSHMISLESFLFLLKSVRYS